MQSVSVLPVSTEKERPIHSRPASEHYKLRCQACGAVYDDDGFILECRNDHAPALLATEYSAASLEADEDTEGIYRYRSWLPITRTLRGAGRTVTYQSKSLSRIMGLTNLWISFNGYWPQKGATIATCTFKEHEAYSVLARIPESCDEVLVVASAGNTAAAFCRACSINRIKCLIIVCEGGFTRGGYGLLRRDQARGLPLIAGRIFLRRWG